MSEKQHDDLSLDPELLVNLKKAFEGRGAILSIAGPDGAGKTTLANQLVEVLTQVGLPANRIHCYSWYKNVFLMPFRLAKLRRENQIVVLDRSLYDNVIEISRKARFPSFLTRGILRTVLRFYTVFDYKYILTAPFDDLVARRPEENKSKTMQQIELYLELAKLANCHLVFSKGSILQTTLEHMTATESKQRHAPTRQHNF